ncbi:adenosylcobinamide-phosphate synthase CbiB [Stappia sp. ES.058]|uniref:adenosylcobinamide-phosphate synthase CbiB n=1 Tax=Stappia sp. ES.058 TaxID=1881061 RepID=UPI00087D96B6|nr:adenosylcobinamide-phosphate synthase CbiB [Stappia sp. ES.058]SDU02053.1 adenosylcobinamide-phosphate synthase [Stappia sp. ES.058]
MLLFTDTALLMLLALLLDSLVGDPPWLWRHVPHPVVLFGKVIEIADQDFNTPDTSESRRKLYGAIFLIALIACALLIGALLEVIFRGLPLGEIGIIVVGAIFIAQRSLYDHVAAVRDGLSQGGLEGGRKAVAMIVGRDPEQLDEAGVARAAIESCAENHADGVVAPVFWFLLLGLPGLLAYKAVNTADSMIGHKTDRHRAFGWASARFDDLVNLPAARLSGLLLALSAPLFGKRIGESLQIMRRDAPKHRSPNAGWPEAAMAAVLGLALAGPRAYAGYRVDDPYMNTDGRRDATAGDIARSLKALVFACIVQAGVVALVAVATLFV